MSFAAFPFLLLFLPVVVAGAIWLRLTAPGRPVQGWILAASIAFYAIGAPRDLPILIGSILANWKFGQVIAAQPERSRRRQRWLQAGLLFNLVLLGVFKYAGFATTTLNGVMRMHMGVPKLVFPLGISFFTLIQVMYLVDCFEALVRPSSLFDHASFVAFFPYMTAGPLARSKPIISQLPELRDDGKIADGLARGLAMFVVGLAKKVLLAEAFGRVADAGFAHIGALSTLEAWVAGAAFLLQIYFDFSGYSDMAMGAALMLGVTIPKNFNSPLRAVSIPDFWQRWHISLTSFITTYLYTPIVRRSRRVTPRLSAIATMIAMTIAGLWHGPSWNYVLWGAIHGVGLAGYQYWKRLKRPLPYAAARIVTLIFVTVAIIPFRAPDVPTALRFWFRLLPHGAPLSTHILSASLVGSDTWMYGPFLVIGVVLSQLQWNSLRLLDMPYPKGRRIFAFSTLAVVSMLYLNSTAAREFLYRAF